MKKGFIFLSLLIAFSSCNTKNEKSALSVVSPKLKKEVLQVAEEFIMKKMKNTERKDSESGIIVFSEGNIKYGIDPSKIITGEINDDNKEDAIITVYGFTDQQLTSTEHLILINTDGKLLLSRAIESEMKVLRIEEKMIIAELPTVSRDSPNYGCEMCKEVVKYKFVNGDLIVVK
jgi:hypothetical protein